MSRNLKNYGPIKLISINIFCYLNKKFKSKYSIKSPYFNPALRIDINSQWYYLRSNDSLNYETFLKKTNVNVSLILIIVKITYL